MLFLLICLGLAQLTSNNSVKANETQGNNNINVSLTPTATPIPSLTAIYMDKGFIDEYSVANGEITLVKHLGDNFHIGLASDGLSTGYSGGDPITQNFPSLLAKIIGNSEGDGNKYNADGLKKVLRVYFDDALVDGTAYTSPNQGGVNFFFRFDTPLYTQKVKNIRLECGYESDMQKLKDSADNQPIVNSVQKFIVNGSPVPVAALNIGGYNYIRVVEFAQLLNIDIAYDESANTVFLDKSKPYAGVRIISSVAN